MQNKDITCEWINWLIILTILVNMCGLFVPILRNDDPVLYANIARHMALSDNFIDLISGGHDWLDKPHFPFWITAVSFKIFGINSFAYILPGFIFNLIGAYYTYRLAAGMFNKDVGLISTIIYVSALHLMLSSIDVRAEAYLLGEIMPACYYFYRYHQKSEIHYRSLLLGALFAALAVMTKGVFVLITIISGLVGLLVYKRQLRALWSLKWLLMLGCIAILILPEIIALYLQFDAHPEKVIFNHTHVSGVAWFFWGSQFGRFFNSGAIVDMHPQPMHYLFFVHTFLWAFLPWSLLFIWSIWKSFGVFMSSNTNDADAAGGNNDRANIVYLLASFFVTFILFSVTKFQLDHYTNILMPFAAILCARWLYDAVNRYSGAHTRVVGRNPAIVNIQSVLGILLAYLALLMGGYIFRDSHFALAISIIGVVGFSILIIMWCTTSWCKAIIYPVLGINLIFILLLLVNSLIYAPYDLGFVTAKYLNQQPRFPIIDYHADSLTLEFYAQAPYYNNWILSNNEQWHYMYIPQGNYCYGTLRASKKNNNINTANVAKLENTNMKSGNTVKLLRSYYVVMPNQDLQSVQMQLSPNSIHVMRHVYAATIDKVIRNLLNLSHLQYDLTDYVIIRVNS